MSTERRTAVAGAQQGISLIDMIAAILVIGIAVTAVMSAFVVSVAHSADPMTRQQAQFIAEAYLDEILLQKFYDPDTDRICPAPEASRSLYDNVCDYAGLTEAPHDQFGNAIAALAAYNVAVTVSNTAAALGAVNLNGLTNDTATPVYRVLRVDVTVTGPANVSITLTGYRANYNCNAAGDPGCKAL